MPETLVDIENYLKYIFEEVLSLETSNIELLILDSPSRPSNFRQTLSEILFENIRVQSLYFVNTAVASLFATGKTQGVAVEVGNASVNIVPIFDGFVLQHAQHLSSYGGVNSTKLI